MNETKMSLQLRRSRLFKPQSHGLLFEINFHYSFGAQGYLSATQESLRSTDLTHGMDIVNLKETEMEMDLAAWKDKDLKWSQKCRQSAAREAMSVLGMIKRSLKPLTAPQRYC